MQLHSIMLGRIVRSLLTRMWYHTWNFLQHPARVKEVEINMKTQVFHEGRKGLKEESHCVSIPEQSGYSSCQISSYLKSYVGQELASEP